MTPPADNPELQNFRLEKLEHDNGEHWKTRESLTKLEPKVDAINASVETLRGDVKALRGALYSLAAGVIIASVAFVFGVIQLTGHG